MADVQHWRPAMGTHAIQLASVAVTFSEPVNKIPWRKIEAAVDAAAEKAGLSAKEPIQVIEMQVTPSGAPSVSTPEEPGFERLRRATPDSFAEKLQVQRNSLLYENWAYTRWAPMKERVSALMREAYKHYSDAVSITSVSASYVDGFRAIMPGVDADVAQIIDRKSRFVAAGAFNRMKPWHTHCGWFDFKDPTLRQLNQIKIDVADAQFPDGLARVVQVYTNVSHQLNQPGLIASSTEAESWELILDRLQRCHESLKDVLGKVLTKEASMAISLGGK